MTVSSKAVIQGRCGRHIVRPRSTPFLDRFGRGAADTSCVLAQLLSGAGGGATATSCGFALVLSRSLPQIGGVFFVVSQRSTEQAFVLVSGTDTTSSQLIAYLTRSKARKILDVSTASQVATALCNINRTESACGKKASTSTSDTCAQGVTRTETKAKKTVFAGALGQDVLHISV